MVSLLGQEIQNYNFGPRLQRMSRYTQLLLVAMTFCDEIDPFSNLFLTLETLHSVFGLYISISVPPGSVGLHLFFFLYR